MRILLIAAVAALSLTPSVFAADLDKPVVCDEGQSLDPTLGFCVIDNPTIKFEAAFDRFQFRVFGTAGATFRGTETEIFGTSGGVTGTEDIRFTNGAFGGGVKLDYDFGQQFGWGAFAQGQIQYETGSSRDVPTNLRTLEGEVDSLTGYLFAGPQYTFENVLGQGRNVTVSGGAGVEIERRTATLSGAAETIDFKTSLGTVVPLDLPAVNEETRSTNVNFALTGIVDVDVTENLFAGVQGIISFGDQTEGAVLGRVGFRF